MRFGLFVSAQHPVGDDSVARVREHLEQVRLARDSGFDSVFAGQHFLSEPFQMLQPIPLLARLAREADGMRIGAGILLLPLLNPVEVAEQAATLDVLTEGRFVLGVGLGYRAEEDSAFGLGERRVRTFVDKLEIVRRLPATTASLGVLSVPVVGIVASVLILGERPTVADMVGSALILAAAAGVLLAPTARSTPSAPIEQ